MRPPAAVAAAAVVAGALSGIPSSLHSALTGRSLLESTRAAGTLLGRRCVIRGVLAHVMLTVGWTGVLAVVLPRRRSASWGAAAGGAIAALDLGVIARRRYPSIAALPRAPQVADHVAFGALAGATLGGLGRNSSWE